MNYLQLDNCVISVFVSGRHDCWSAVVDIILQHDNADRQTVTSIPITTLSRADMEDRLFE